MERFEINKSNTQGSYLLGVGQQSYSDEPGKVQDTYIYTGPSSENSILFGYTTDGGCFGSKNCGGEFVKSGEITRKGSIYTSSGIYIGPNLLPGEQDKLSKKYEFMLKSSSSNYSDTYFSTDENRIGGKKTLFRSETEFTEPMISTKSATFNKLCIGVSTGNCTDLQEKINTYDSQVDKLQKLEARYNELKTTKLDTKVYNKPTHIYFSYQGTGGTHLSGKQIEYAPKYGGEYFANFSF